MPGSFHAYRAFHSELRSAQHAFISPANCTVVGIGSLRSNTSERSGLRSPLTQLLIIKIPLARGRERQPEQSERVGGRIHLPCRGGAPDSILPLLKLPCHLSSTFIVKCALPAAVPSWHCQWQRAGAWHWQPAGSTPKPLCKRLPRRQDPPHSTVISPLAIPWR